MKEKKQTFVKKYSCLYDKAEKVYKHEDVKKKNNMHSIGK